jgi:uncharacterized protein (TIGR02599 family)
MSNYPNSDRRRGFTLLELMVSMSVLSLIMLLVFQMLSHTQRAWSGSRARLSTFKEARTAFEAITRRLGQATLNTYWDYEMSGSGSTALPTGYKKESDMHFVCGQSSDLLGSAVSVSSGHAIFFQAPVGFSLLEENQGLGGLLNAWGFYVELANEDNFIPTFLTSAGVKSRERYRLMEFRPPSENLALYATDMKNGSGASLYSWFKGYIDGQSDGVRFSRPIAENIILLIIEPRESNGVSNTSSLAPNYKYDSREVQGSGSDKTVHALPQLVDVTMVAIDETSAIRYEQINGSLSGMLQGAGFTSSSAYDSDLARLRVSLRDAGVDFRIFQETVVIRASKWGIEEGPE